MRFICSVFVLGLLALPAIPVGFALGYLLTGAVEVYLSVISNRLNEVMKVLTVITATVGALAVITGFYGMNFTRTFPPFEWRYGVLAVLGFMIVTAAVMLAAFRRLRWL